MAFAGLRVLSLESRRSKEIGQLIAMNGGDPFVAPSMREAPLADNSEAVAFAENLFAGAYDSMIFLTGVGTRALNRVLAEHFPAERFAEALRTITVVARGPKPAAALRELNVPIAINVPEPNTWRELLVATEGMTERRIAVQEYGKSNTDLLEALRQRGAEVTPVRVYEWDLPEDTGPLREAAHRLARGEVDVFMITTSIQIHHLMKIAAEEGVENQVLAAFPRLVVASIGPTASEALEDFGIITDFAPSHPKMGFLVKEASERAHEILARKRGQV